MVGKGEGEEGRETGTMKVFRWKFLADCKVVAVQGRNTTSVTAGAKDLNADDRVEAQRRSIYRGPRRDKDEVISRQRREGWKRAGAERG